MITAVLFDMDGTLFDTERVNHDAWVAVGLPEGLYWHCIGRDRTEILSLMKDRLHQEPEPLYARYHEEAARHLKETGIPPRPRSASNAGCPAETGIPHGCGDIFV
ncbi:HAD family phosphatase [Caproicibacterium lactatifermentans]|uniref:HAD family phosphatase n=1 Tax=Caproicibacterium lactatifermentans TaxID=2666138 RepID=A0ABX6PTP2_9FIRM|nr:HAD family phosphatase [Caproicibacterium lactatifermentans]QKO29599.1 hypothetical protein GKP14_00295 [Caproicibacterium lactatifermentans]